MVRASVGVKKLRKAVRNPTRRYRHRTLRVNCVDPSRAPEPLATREDLSIQAVYTQQWEPKTSNNPVTVVR
ncbi:hypothetical protein GCM10027355_34460 [Haloplanus salinarum]